MPESCFPNCQNCQHSKHSQPVRTAFVKKIRHEANQISAEVTMLVARVASIPSKTLAVLHEAGKEVSDMICMQCCRSCRSTDPTVAVRFAAVLKYDIEVLKPSDLLGLCLSSLQQVALNEPLHCKNTVAMLQRRYKSCYDPTSYDGLVLLPLASRNTCALASVSTGWFLPVAHRNTCCALAKVSTG